MFKWLYYIILCKYNICRYALAVKQKHNTNFKRNNNLINYRNLYTCIRTCKSVKQCNLIPNRINSLLLRIFCGVTIQHPHTYSHRRNNVFLLAASVYYISANDFSRNGPSLTFITRGAKGSKRPVSFYCSVWSNTFFAFACHDDRKTSRGLFRTFFRTNRFFALTFSTLFFRPLAHFHSRTFFASI